MFGAQDRDALIEAQVPALRRFARSLCHAPDAADDLVQDCLEQALGAWPRRRAEADLRAWLFTILYNLFVSDRRRTARRGRLLAAQGTPQDATPQGQEAAVHCAEVLAQLDALPADQRAVLCLIAVEDLGYEQAARVLGVPVGTVMSRLSRARERLRQMAEARPARPALRRVV
jgi:RNA polymerase sigma-70 factor (ECF subfamily)